MRDYSKEQRHLAIEQTKNMPVGINNTSIQIFNIIRNSNGISRAELARVIGMSKSTISQHVNVLIDLGFIVESDETQFSGGRKAQLLKLHKTSGYVLAIDLGATSLNISICNLNAEPLIIESEDTNVADGPEIVLNRIVDVSRNLLNKLDLSSSLLKGVGIGLPGPVEFSSGIPVAPPIMPGWDQYPVRGFLEKEFGCPAYVDNDVNIMTLGEQWAGIGKDVQNFIFIKVGTGIGSGIVCQGNLYRGSMGCAGDIGHIGIDGLETVCSCGNKGCLESLAGGKAISMRAIEQVRKNKSQVLADLLAKQGSLSAKEVGLAASMGDAASVEIIKESGKFIGQVLAKLINFFNPSLVVIGGGVANLGDLFLASIRGAVYNRSLPLATRNLSIERSVLNEQAGIIGAAAMVLDKLFLEHMCS